MAVALALAAALGYGVSDFVGGVLSKRRSLWMVATASQVTAAAATASVALAVPGHPRALDFAWGAAAGIAGGVGVSALYRGLSRGRMGVVAPISGTGSALVPVIVGLATGDRPPALAWIGMAIALPAIVLIPQTRNEAATVPDGNGERPPVRPPGRPAWHGAGYGAIAGVGFGALFATIKQIGGHAGFWPLALTQLMAAVTVAVVAAVLHQRWLPRGRRLVPVYAFGLLGAAALVCFQLATRHGRLTIVSVIAALYPAVTVAMAAVLLRERLGRVQSLGLALAVIAVVLVTIG